MFKFYFRIYTLLSSVCGLPAPSRPPLAPRGALAYWPWLASLIGFLSYMLILF